MPRRKRDDAGGGQPSSPPSPLKRKKKKKKSRHLDPKTSEGGRTQIEPVETTTSTVLENGLSEVLTKELPKVLTKLLPKLLTKILPKVLPRFISCPASPSTPVNQNGTPRYKLSFHMNGLSTVVYTRKAICDNHGDPLKIRITANGHEEIDARILYAKIRVVVLYGDFNWHNEECWTSEEFVSSIVRPRDKPGAVLTGVSELSLTDGEAHLSGLTFVDNSKFVRSGKFRLGVMVIDNFGERVQEGITEPFTVMDGRGEGSKKHEIPLLSDDVWRLKKIAKGGTAHGALKNSGISFVKDLLSWYYKDEQHLREILNIGTKEYVWTTIIEHAKKCDPGPKLYSFAVEGNSVILFFNSICQIIGVKFGEQYTPFDDLEKSKKDLVIQWSKLGYKNMTFDQPDYEMDNGEPRPIDQEMFYECTDPMQGCTAEEDTSGNQFKQRESDMLESVGATQNGKPAQLQEQQQHLDELGRGLEEEETPQDLDTVTQPSPIELENTQLRAQVAELRAQLAELRDSRFNEPPSFVNHFGGSVMSVRELQPMTRSSSHGSFSAALTPYPASTDDGSNAGDIAEDLMAALGDEASGLWSMNDIWARF